MVAKNSHIPDPATIPEFGESLYTLLHAAPVAMVVVNRAGLILLANAKFARLFGYTLEELRQEMIEVLLPESLRQVHVQHREQFNQSPHVRAMGVGFDLVGRHKNGTLIPIEVGLGYGRLRNEIVTLASVIDISLRKQTEAILEARVQERTAELERRRQVADGLRDILTLINSHASSETILRRIVVQAVEVLGAQAGAICQLHHRDGVLHIKQCYNLDITVAALQLMAGAIDTPIYQVLETRQPVINMAAVGDATEPDGPNTVQAWLTANQYHALLAAPLLVRDEIYGTLVLFYAAHTTAHTTVTQEKVDLLSTFCVQAALAIENARLHDQIERNAVAAERNRIAHDLHDSVTQTLFSASIIADVLPRLWQRNQREAERRLHELRELTRGALAEMRTLLLELRPQALINVALTDLLHQLAEAVGGRSRVPITVTIQGEEDLPVEVRIAFYRITQEALNNVAKHAEATQATLFLNMTADKAELLIQDNGRGFLPGIITGNCLGLNIMRERAEEIRAQLAIQSQPDQGALVHAIWHRPEQS
ncbi:MAG: PAS domain S-box protein [Caldilineaceae bacterium]|nr:PAS domain S-box protein [Caldilineaceae bacterium]